jgi:NADPH2:quinone reductase
MRAVVVEEYGGPEQVVLRDLPEPTPGPGEVTIDVAFAGMNFTDIRNRWGDGLGVVPFVPGVEVSGTVRAVGEGVAGLHPGQPVAALTRGQAHAEVTTAPAVLTVPLPDSLVGRPESGGMLITVSFALLLLRRAARGSAEDVILLHGAAGGVGTVVGQLAAAWGWWPPWGTTSGPDRADFARDHGYDRIFGYDDFDEQVRDATAGRGVDVVLDAVGGGIRARSFEVLAPFGRLVTYSNISREPETAPTPEWLRARCVSHVGLSTGALAALAPDVVRASLEESVALVAAGAVHVEVTAVLPLEEAAEAHRRLEGRAVVGKLILVP